MHESTLDEGAATGAIRNASFSVPQFLGLATQSVSEENSCNDSHMFPADTLVHQTLATDGGYPVERDELRNFKTDDAGHDITVASRKRNALLIAKPKWVCRSPDSLNRD